MQPPLSLQEIEKMRKSCRLAAQALENVGKYVRAGITTDELDQIAADFVKTRGAVSAPLGYHGYPKSICTSVNHIVCHGVPDSTVLKDGDIINVDVTTILEGFFGDTSMTFIVGEGSAAAKELVEAAFEARQRGIEAILPGGLTGDVGFSIDKYVTRKGYSTVKEIGGHGIGRVFHDEPFVPSFGKKGKGDPLMPWHCITVEPMVNEGVAAVKEFDIPNSSIKFYETADKKLSAQFEHTVLITDKGYEILTLP